MASFMLSGIIWNNLALEQFSYQSSIKVRSAKRCKILQCLLKCRRKQKNLPKGEVILAKSEEMLLMHAISGLTIANGQ